MKLSQNSKKPVKEFYIYYEFPEVTSKSGKIKAISPRLLNGMKNPYFAIDGDLGLKFIEGKESPSNWIVAWNEASSKMELTRHVEQKPAEETTGEVSLVSLGIHPFMKIPYTSDKEPEVLVMICSNKRTAKISLPAIEVEDADGRKMDFFVTYPDDPNVLYFHFGCTVTDALQGHVISLPEIPDEFSVYTKWIFDQYMVIRE